MCVAGEGDGFSHTIGAVVFYHRGHDAAVGGAATAGFTEGDVTGVVGIVSDD